MSAFRGNCGINQVSTVNSCRPVRTVDYFSIKHTVQLPAKIFGIGSLSNVVSMSYGDSYHQSYQLLTKAVKMTSQENVSDKKVQLLKVLSAWDTSAYITCSIIGSGIFISPKGRLNLVCSFIAHT